MDDNPQQPAATRRKFLAAVGGFAGSFAAATDRDSTAGRGDTRLDGGGIREVVGEAPVREGKVKLDVPPLVENGNAVSLTVSVESPMTESEHVKSIHIFNEKNPQANVTTFYLGPRAGRARVSCRIRLADSQKVVAIARLSDDSFWSDSVDVMVTLAACLEELR